MKKYIKFTGKFTDLIPDGWKFQKLFANNYRQYHKTYNGEEYSQGCRIWQHLGGYMEIEDLFGDSYLIIEMIQSGEIYNLATHLKPNGVFIFEEEDVYWLKHDMINHRFEKRDFEKHMRPLYDIDKLPENERENAYSKYYDQWREFNLANGMIPFIKNLLDKGWISVQDDCRKK